MTSADIILQQLGGNKFRAMTGAHNFMHTDEGNTLLFKFKGSRRYNHCSITLNGKDLYDIKIGQIRKFELIPRDEIKDLYVENLRSYFTDVTGLRTSL